MKRALLCILFVEILVILIIPTLMIRGFNLAPPGPAPSNEGVQGAVNVRVFIHSTGRVEDIPLERYVAGVVAAEMPASFGMEALKAQAVAARTYVVKRMKTFGGPGSPEHPDADICTDPNHSQAWISEDTMRSVWGTANYARYHERIQEAVASTAGLVMTYGGRPVDPLYHSTSGGPTEDASEVWSESVPYLKSVPCDYCRHSPHYSQVVDMSLDELGTRLGNRDVPVFLSSGKGKAEVAALTQSGRVKTLKVAGAVLRGQDARSVLGLPSTRFRCEIRGNTIRFHVSGKGHGVGMCQYGADGLSRQKKSFREILSYYYSGVTIRDMFEE